MHRISHRLILALIAGLLDFTAFAQWTTQTLTLRPGWNAVFLEVQPEPTDCDAIFAGVPIESVWAWNRRFSPVQFIQDPDQLIPGQPEWLTYLPPSHLARATMNLFILQGNRAYLIKLPSNAGTVTCSIHGRPVIRGIDWVSDSFNFVGFHVSQNNPPTFQTFFASAAAHAGKPVYRLNASGSWERVSNQASTTLKSGEAYWIRCDGPSSFAGPLIVTMEQRTGLDYGRSLMEQTLRLRNGCSVTNAFVVKHLPSATPPNSTCPVLAGEVALSYFRMDLTNNQVGWVQLPKQLTQVNIPPGEEWALRLEVRRPDMAPPPDSAGALYQSLLEVTDTIGARYLVPVTAEGLQSATAPGKTAAHARAGLWVGSAVLKKVNEAAKNNNPVPTPSEFQFRLIVHVNTNGQPRLLQKVLQMWKDGTYTNDAQGVQVVDKPGRFVLLTDEALVPNYSGSTIRDGRAVGRRISSAAFAFSDPKSLNGAGDFGANTISNTVSLDYNDRLNPFKHRYHPDHNNLDEDYAPTLPNGKESFTVERQITLQFTQSDPDGLTLAGWGDNQLGGLYSEDITGLHRNQIRLRGSFRLHHVSRVGVLNDQN